MKFFRYFLISLLPFAYVEVQGQSVLNCLMDGEHLPVAEIRNSIPYCFTGDSLVKGKKKTLSLAPSDGFGDGFVHLEIRENVRGGVTKQDGILSFASDSDWYLFVATIVPDRDLDDCYYALAFDTYGTKSYYTRKLGKLLAGKERTIRVFLKLKYEMPDQLHIFSGMEEIRTTLLPRDYVYRNGHCLLAAN